MTPPRRHLAAALFLCGLIPGIYEFHHHSGFGFGHGYEMVATAHSLAMTGTFGNPYEPHVTGPTAANPPLYPIVLAGLMKLFGEPGFVLAAVLLNILLNAAIAALLPRVSRIVCGEELPGVFAGALWICAMRLLPQWDTTLTMAGLVVLCLASAREVERSRAGWGTGVLGGAVSLLNPATVLIFFPWIAWLLWAKGATLRRAAAFSAAVALAVAAANAPWAIRNYRTWGAPVLRTNFGYTIYSSNNDCARSSLYANAAAGCYQQTHPVASETEIRLLQALGEVRYDRLRTADTLRWIAAHPARFRELTLQRFVEFWFPDPRTAPRAAYAIWVITALSIPGVILMARRRQSAVLCFLAAWLLYPPMFYIVVSGDRYRFPLLWTSLLPAGCCAAWLWRRLAQRDSTQGACENLRNSPARAC